jgi:hypothetical protein
MEQIFMESLESHREEVIIWRLCYVVSHGKKITFRQIPKKVVWPIQGTILFTQ